MTGPAPATTDRARGPVLTCGSSFWASYEFLFSGRRAVDPAHAAWHSRRVHEASRAGRDEPGTEQGRPSMDLITTLATQVGIDPKVAEQGLGALLGFLKQHLSPELFGTVETSVPGADGAIKSFEDEAGPVDEAASPGLLGSLIGMASKLAGGGGGSAVALLALLGKAGLSVDQIAAFLPKAIELMKAYLPQEVIDKIIALVPGADALTGGATEKA
ncbi:DUF2780 domain-containing protein [Isosphaeraceae bacterium EP7]